MTKIRQNLTATQNLKKNDGKEGEEGLYYLLTRLLFLIFSGNF